MRISDWSSDVCSSDLDIPPAELKSDPARLADEAAATSMFAAGSLIRVTNIRDESVDAVSALLESAAAGNPVLAYAGALRTDSKLLKLVELSPLALHVATSQMYGRAAVTDAYPTLNTQRHPATP